MDLQIAILLNKLGAGTFVDSISQFISRHLVLAILCAILVLLTLIFDKAKRKKILIAVAIAICLHFLISEFFLKHFLDNFFELRTRPYLAHPDLIKPLGTNDDASFPSNHMSSITAILTVFVYYYRKKWLVWTLAVLFLLAMAFARIHNGMHYPTDVLGGTIFGVIYGITAVSICRRFLR